MRRFINIFLNADRVRTCLKEGLGAIQACCAAATIFICLNLILCSVFNYLISKCQVLFCLVVSVPRVIVCVCLWHRNVRTMEVAVFVRLFCTCGAEATGTDSEFVVLPLIACPTAAWVYRWNVSSALPMQKGIGRIYYK